MPTDEEVAKNIGENVSRLIDERGLSQSELARMTGQTQAAISLICAGKRLPGSGVLARIAEAFDVSMDRLAAAVPSRNLARSH
jgi:transcriptional regulator with XRE-family HTH domain